MTISKKKLLKKPKIKDYTFLDDRPERYNRPDLPKPDLPKVVVILGPTASGKTTLGIKFAQKFNGEIISADSRQIYRGLDIGTAKPQRDIRNSKFEIRNYISDGIPHHLINIRNPDQPYTVAQYKRDCLQPKSAIITKKKIPVIVGGTGIYIKVVVDNLTIPRAKADPLLRKELENELENRGLQFLYNELIALDPEAAYIIDPKNPRRVIRALEIALSTKKPFSGTRRQGKPLFDFLQIGISSPKEKLKERINRRIDAMIEEGLVNEVRSLIKKYPAKLIAFEAIGYREIIDYLQGKSSLEDAVELMKKNTWQFAKRQLTWFRKVEPRGQTGKITRRGVIPRGAESRTEGRTKGKYLETSKRPSGARNKTIHWITAQKEAEELVSRFL